MLILNASSAFAFTYLPLHSLSFIQPGNTPNWQRTTQGYLLDSYSVKAKFTAFLKWEENKSHLLVGILIKFIKIALHSSAKKNLKPDFLRTLHFSAGYIHSWNARDMPSRGYWYGSLKSRIHEMLQIIYSSPLVIYIQSFKKWYFFFSLTLFALLSSLFAYLERKNNNKSGM